MPEPTKHLVVPNFTRITRVYFDEIVRPTFSKVARNTIPIRKNYCIGGNKICLSFYSEQLLQKLSHALMHLEGEAVEKPDLTVHLWDSVSTKTSIPSPFEHTSHQFILETQTNTEITDQFLGIFLSGEQTLNLYDTKNRTAYFWTRDANLLPDWLSAAPIRPILHWFLSRSNIHLIHGAVIGVDDRAVLLSAKGGSGKSTTAIASVLAGMNYLGDDYVGIESGKTIVAHSLYNSAKVDDRTIAQFPLLKKHIVNPNHKPEDKAIVFFSEILEAQVKQHASLAAILIPRIIDGASTRIIPATKLEAMLALTPTTLFQLPLAGTHQLSALKRIIEKTPCYILELGLPIENVPNVIKTVLCLP
ncbi:MAG: hypothetical protein NTX72_03115 [Candidatus Uhrbacteria bacterium]|nr:hypothetical protein [Candidatus Uhrbacteria bacterium]